MLDKIVLVAGLSSVGGYVYYEMKDVDPTIYPYSREQAQSMLASAKTSLPRRDGPGEIRLWSTGRSARGVALAMQYASGAPLSNCEAVVTAVAPDKTRVVPDCSEGPKSESVIARTTDELRVPMFDEHIRATLGKRAFDRANVDRKEAAAVFRNLGDMQREALQHAADARRDEVKLGR